MGPVGQEREMMDILIVEIIEEDADEHKRKSIQRLAAMVRQFIKKYEMF